MFKNFINNDLNTKNVITLYFIYIFLIIILSFVYSKLYLSKNPEIILNDNKLNIIKLQFDHGKLVKNITEKKEFFQEIDGIKYYLIKLPIYPILISLLLFISKNYYFIFISKAIIFFSLFFFTIRIFCNDNKINTKFFLIFLISTIFIPYNLHVYFNINFSDSIGSMILSCVFLLCLSKKKKFLFLATLLSLLYLTKSSYFFITIFIALYLFIFSKEKKKIFPSIFLISTIFIWGIYGLKKSNMFPFFSSISSHGQYQFQVVLNDKFKEIYPQLSVDLIKLPELPKTISTEKGQYLYYQKLANQYLSNNENFKNYLLDRIKVLKFIFFGIKQDSKFQVSENINYSSMINKIFLNSSILLSIFLIFKYKSREEKFINYFYLLFIFFCMLPHLVSWATSKHLVGISQISIFYLLWRINLIIRKN